jgi:hypothetical protein
MILSSSYEAARPLGFDSAIAVRIACAPYLPRGLCGRILPAQSIARSAAVPAKRWLIIPDRGRRARKLKPSGAHDAHGRASLRG